LEGGGGGEAPGDIFDMFFGGGRGRRGQSGPPRGEDIQHVVKASLEDLYNGRTVRLAISRNKPCPDCEGRGGKVGCEKICNDCQGRGVKIQLRQIGPGMVQQVQSSCATCRGQCLHCFYFEVSIHDSYPKGRGKLLARKINVNHVKEVKFIKIEKCWKC
jgi:DnaJ family protein A protein 2